MPSEKITIVKLGRKQQPSKYKPGETYSITTVLDQNGRKLSGIGKWTENWKIGDIIEGTVEERKWTDKDGFEQISLSIKDPNAQNWSFRRGTLQNNIVVISYQISATIASLIFAGKKKVTLDDIDKLAEEIKKRLAVSTENAATETQEPEKKTAEINLDEEEKKEDTTENIETEDDEDEPF